jgi:hypothetical protein
VHVGVARFIIAAPEHKDPGVVVGGSMVGSGGRRLARDWRHLHPLDRVYKP